MMPPIIITGSPAWASAVERAATEAGYTLERLTTREGYINYLTDNHAAMVIVDTAQAEWSWWATTAKASPATRRIPIVAVSPHSLPLEQGVDFHLRPDELTERLPPLITQHARAQTEAERSLLLSQCDNPLPPRAQEAIAQFNNGEYYKQHDLLEELWMEEEGPVRDLYRAILQVGVAFYQVQRGNIRGAYKMLLRAVQWLTVLPDACQGVDVAQLRADAAALRNAIEAGEEELDGYLTSVHFV